MKKFILLFFLLFCDFAQAQVTQGMSLETMRMNLAKIEKSVEETREKLKEVRDARFLPDLYFALAEFYVQQAQYMYLIKVTENEGTPVEELDFTNEKRPKLKAIETYDNILEKFPNLKDRDKAMFLKGHEQRSLGRLDDMVRTYSELAKEFPKSKYWSESVIIIGDFQFENKKDNEGALQTYQRILKRKTGPFTPLAHYKIGWSYINLEKFDKALLSFEKVLTEFRDMDLSSLPDSYKKTDVRRDALIASVWPYSELDRKQLRKLGGAWRYKPIPYYRALSPDLLSYRRVLSRLGRRMQIKKRHINATQAFYELLRLEPDFEKQLDLVEQVYVNMKNTRRSWPIVGFVEEIQQLMTKVRSSNILTNAQKKKYEHDFEIYTRDVATRMNKRSKKTRNKTDWGYTARDYKAYLETFPRSKYALKLRLNMAESFFNSGELLEAAKHYEKIAKVLRTKKLRKDLWDSAIESYIGAIRRQSKLTKLELTEARHGMRSAGNSFIQSYPKDKAVPDIIFNIGQTYYDERNFDRAINAFDNYIKRFPNGPKANLSVNLILDSYNQIEEYEKIINYGRKIIADKRIKDRSLKSQVGQIVQQAEMRNVQAQTGDLSSAEYAQNLLSLARKYKGSNLGDQALYEAFKTFKAQKDPRAYKSGEQLILQHGKSQYAQAVVNDMGQMALITADFKRAALYFELYNEKYPNEQNSRALLENAAKMREAMGDFKIAARNYNKLGDRTSAARMDYLAQDWASLTRSAPRATGTYSDYWLGIALYRLKGIGPARGALTRAAQLSGGSEENEMAAHALYLLAQDAMIAYKNIQLKAGNEAKAVNNKSASLQRLTQDLTRVVKSGSGRWTIAGLYGLGQANKEFANFILAAPVPKGLTAAEQGQYQQALKQQAASYNQAARNYFNECIKSAEKFEIFTNFVNGCQSLGKIEVSEAKEVRTFLRASDKVPAGASAVRSKLFDNPRDTKLLSQLAGVYLKANDYSMAELILNRALEISENDPTIMAQIGSIKLYKNELQEAKSWFKQSLEKSRSTALAVYGMMGLYNKFKFNNKLSSMRRMAKSKPNNDAFLHPMIRAVL